MSPEPEGIVYDGDAMGLYEWCRVRVGLGLCHYQWGGMDWRVTITTQNGHEPLYHGDAVRQVGPSQLAIIRRGQS